MAEQRTHGAKSPFEKLNCSIDVDVEDDANDDVDDDVDDEEEDEEYGAGVEGESAKSLSYSSGWGEDVDLMEDRQGGGIQVEMLSSFSVRNTY